MNNRISSHLLLTEAIKFLQAANCVCKRPVTQKEKLTCGASRPAYYLVGHSIELSLKAFLMGRGLDIQKLRSKKYGHDLTKLIIESRKRKLGLEVKLEIKQINIIKNFSSIYKNKLLEYPEVGFYSFPLYTEIFEIGYNLIVGLREYCYFKTFNKPLSIQQRNKDILKI